MSNKPMMERVLVTPLNATKWLECNRLNRTLSHARVDIYADAMKRGSWGETNDAIVFDLEGNLLNGQHRLSAVVKSGKSVWIPVVRGVPSETFKHIDGHAKRTMGDALSIGGESNGRALAAAARFLVAWDRGGVTVRGIAKAAYISIEDIENCIAENPVLRESVALVRAKKSKRGMFEGSWLAGLHVLFSRKNRDEADRFITDIIEGADLPSNDPVYKLREKLLTVVASGMTVSPGERVNWIIRAWNHRRSGTKPERFARGRRTKDDDEVKIPAIK